MGAIQQVINCSWSLPAQLRTRDYDVQQLLAIGLGAEAGAVSESRSPRVHVPAGWRAIAIGWDGLDLLSM